MGLIKPFRFTCQHCGNIFETDSYTHSRDGFDGPWYNRAKCPKCGYHTIQKEKSDEKNVL